MDKSLYIAMSGAKQTLLAQTANANNLANAQTSGFKSDLEQFRSMPVYGPGYPTRVYAMAERPGTDLSPGAIQQTGRDLDVAVEGDGWLAVQGADGKEAYTRAGDLRITPEGLLQTGTGLQVLGQDGPSPSLRHKNWRLVKTAPSVWCRWVPMPAIPPSSTGSSWLSRSYRIWKSVAMA